MYGSLLKRARAQSHERFVAWAERENAERGRGTSSRRSTATTSSRPTATGPSSVRSTQRVVRSRSARRRSCPTPAVVRWPAATSGMRVTAHAGGCTPADVLVGGSTSCSTSARPSSCTDSSTRRARSSRRARASPIELGDERLMARMAINELTLEQFAGTGSPAQQIDRAKRSSPCCERYKDDFALARAWNEVVVRELTLGRYDSGAESADKLVGDYAKRSGDLAPGPRMPRPTLAYLMVHGGDPRARRHPGVRGGPAGPSSATRRPRRS